MSVLDQFFMLYSEVFNPDGSVKNCGLKHKKRLIVFCNQNFSDTYGNEETGYIYFNKMDPLYHSLASEKEDI